MSGSAINVSNKKPLWFYQSNPNPFDPNEMKEWQRYSEFENEYIEEAFKQKEQEVHLKDYVIDFKRCVQYTANDKNKQRPVKREDINISQYIREERFSYPEKVNRSFSTNDKYVSPLIEHWMNQNRALCNPEEINWEAIVEQAVTGILTEGKLLNEEFNAKKMVEKLKACKTSWELQRCSAHLYSAETFLYKLVNSSLRNETMSKSRTIGPFCFLLWMHLRFGDECARSTVYRGVTLTDEMINDYKSMIGKDIKFPAFTSTTKRMDATETFGDSLFVIKLFSGIHAIDISDVSYYPGEQEVLIRANQCFTVVDVKTHPQNNKKHLIFLAEPW